MKKLTLFTKVIIPIVVLGVIVSFIGFKYLNNLIETTIEDEIEQKISSKVNFVLDHVESDFKLLFYLYGTSSKDYKTQEFVSKKDTISGIKKHNSKSKDIIYILDSKEELRVTPLGLNDINIKSLLKSKKTDIEINQKIYEIKTIYFKPWDWTILYLLDVSSFKDILHKNQLMLLGIVYILLLIIIIYIIISFRTHIQKPIGVLLEHFEDITKGKYRFINQFFGTKEIDSLVSHFNTMTNSIKNREIELKDLITKTKENEEYVSDILGSQKNIIIVNDTLQMLKANSSFFRLFKGYKTLEEFKAEHDCVCDYFEKEDEYIYDFDDKNWVEYIIEHSNELHKVKIKQNNQIYIFAVEATKLQKHTRIIISMTDITELEKSNTLLSEYKRAVDAGAIVSKTDLNGKITYVNDLFVHIGGYSRDELLSKNHNVVRSPSTPSKVFKKMWKTIQAKQIWQGNIENRKKDGTFYYVRATIIPILDENGEIMEYLALRYDITEQVKAKEKAQKAEEAKGLFLANMSHEIRTPLNAIIGFTKILDNLELPSKASKYVGIVDQSAQNLLGIINDVLDIAKIESGNLVIEKIEFNLVREFEGFINLFKARVDEKNIELISFIDPKIPQTILSDSLRLTQVLSNLLSNAIKFTDDGGIVYARVDLIEIVDSTCKLKFSIKDSGIGIEKDKQKLIFKAFSQADDSTSREFGGTGLGLSISSKIVQELGSKIEIDSEVGEGSTFSFELVCDIKKSQNPHLEKFEKLKICMLDIEKMDTLQYKILKEYLSSFTSMCEIEDSSQKEKILKQDIVFLDEESVDENIVNLKLENTKFVILTKGNRTFENLSNVDVLQTPFNASDLFNILIKSIDKTYIIEDKQSKDYQKYSGNVLIAEDHDINRQLISALLDLRNIEHEFAHNGIEAVDMFSKSKYDLILMDMNMPEKSGLEASCEILAIEKEQNLEHTPIYALTANAIDGYEEKVLQNGIDGYLTKPIDERKLDEVFTKYLGSGGVDVSYDMDQSSKEMGLDSKIVQKIVLNFCSTIDKDIDLLSSAIEKNDFEQILNSSHKIKGAALNLRMHNLSSFASSIEKQAIEKENISLKDEFKNLKNAVKFIQESNL